MAIAAVRKGTATSPFSLFSDPFPITTINSYSNTAKVLNPDDALSRTQFLDFVKDRSKSKSENLKLDDALGWFDRMLLMKPLPPVDVFNHLLGAVNKIKHHSTLAALYMRMKSTGIAPDIFTLNTLLNCYRRLKRVDLGFAILGDIFKRDIEPDVVTYGIIIDGLCKSGKVDAALEMLKAMEKGACRPDTFVYNTIIHGLCKKGL
ncbi:hypothetical protein AAC387_Pa08g2607 [Persea americana]